MDNSITCLTISDFNLGNFNALLANDESVPEVVPLESSYGQVYQVLAGYSDQYRQQGPACAMIWTRPESVIPSYSRLIRYENIQTDVLLSEVRQYADLIALAADHTQTVFVIDWVRPTYDRGHGMLDLRSGQGSSHLLMRMNIELCEALSSRSNVFVLSSRRWIEKAGSGAFNPKLWYMGKIPFSNDVFRSAVTDIKAALNGLAGRARKLVIVDLDDTLWGGIVGDAGWENLVLGGHDPVGEAFADFQIALKSLANRGLLLGIVSKNEESVAMEAISRHPEMVLKQDDFAGWRINWKDKAQNIVDLVTELNLGLQSVVFIDDSPAERARVRDVLPEVFVPEWPKDKMMYTKVLLELDCFDTPSLTSEDRQRTRMYAGEKKRKASQVEVASIEEWLAKLQVQVEIELLHKGNLARASQLLNKTNQMNLSTRRMTEEQFMNWALGKNNRVWTFRISDKFGAMGLTGITSISVEQDEARIIDFVLSCRVFARKIEEVMLAVAVEYARSLGLRRVVAKYLQTAKNKPCMEFFMRCGMNCDMPEDAFTWSTEKDYPYPEQLHIEWINKGQGDL